MANNDKSVYERLDSIEATQSATQLQNEEIIRLLKNLNDKQPVNKNVEIKPQIQVSEEQLLKNFVRSSKKEYVWFGPTDEFNKSRAKLNLICFTLIVVGVISTILTTTALKMYSTFTLFENLWLIFACVMFSHSLNAKKRILDTDLRDHSNTVYIQDADGTWRDTNKEKKRFRWLRRISYFAALGNIIVIWVQSKGAIAVTATIFELAFVGLTVGMFFAYVSLFCMYENFILFTGRNISNNENVTLIFDVVGRKLAPYKEYKEKMKDNI